MSYGVIERDTCSCEKIMHEDYRNKKTINMTHKEPFNKLQAKHIPHNEDVLRQ